MAHCYFGGFMRFIERETHNFNSKFIQLSHGENLLSVHGIKSDEKSFFCQIYVIFGSKMVHVVIDGYFSLFLKGFKVFFKPQAITYSPFKVYNKIFPFPQYPV